MSELTKRDRRELEALRRRIAHAQRQHVASLERIFRQLPPELDSIAEPMLRLPSGAIAHWRSGDELEDAVEAIFEWLAHDGHERRNGGDA